MNSATTFACHYARLMWLVIHEPRNVSEQKEALRAARDAIASTDATLARRGTRVFVNGVPLPDTLAAAPEMAGQMSAHGIRVMVIASNAPPAELLGTARLLASPGATNDRGRLAQERLAALGTGAIRVAFEDPALAPALDDLVPDEARPITVPTPRVTNAMLAMAAPAGAVVDTPSMFQHFRAAPNAKDGIEGLLAELDAAKLPAEVNRIVTDLALVAEQAARDGRTHELAAVCAAFVARESTPAFERHRQALNMALRRLLRPGLLRAMAELLPRKRDMAAQIEAVIVRAGEDGADAVIETLTRSSLATDRRVYLEVLPRLHAAVPGLIHMLGDARWFVARNAADLLGEMKCTSAESALLPLLQHNDDRVRRSAANALINIGSNAGFRAVSEMLEAQSPRTRADAAAALASRRDERSTATLRNALEDEPDTEVQMALLAALGKIATAQAVEQLVRAAEPKRRLLERKSTAFRVAAVAALGEARTPAALAALTVLREDKEREVRDAAERAYQHAKRT